MKRIGLQWRIFLITCYIQLVSFGIILGSLIITVFTESRYSGNELTYILLTILGLTLICLNYFLDVFVFHKYFPDRATPSRTSTLIQVSGIISTLLFGGLTYFFITGLQFYFSARHPSEDDISLLILFILFLLIILGVYTLIFQFRLSGVLKRNNKTRMTELINSIGEEEPDGDN